MKRKRRDVTVESGAGAGYGSGGAATVTAGAGGGQSEDFDPRLDFTALDSREETNSHLQRLRCELVTVSVGPQDEDDRIDVRVQVGDTIENDRAADLGLGYFLAASVVGPSPIEVSVVGPSPIEALGPTELLPMEVSDEWFVGGYVNSLGALAIDLTNGARIIIEPLDSSADGAEDTGGAGAAVASGGSGSLVAVDAPVVIPPGTA